MKNFFSHDEGARNDPKLIKVLMRLGQAGKGVYWDLVEMLYEQDGYLMHSDCESYAFALRTECDVIERLITEFDLFATDGVRFWSESVLRRLSIRKAKSLKASESAQKRWGDASAMRTHSEGNANTVKEKKEKERKEENTFPDSDESAVRDSSTPDNSTAKPEPAGFEVFWDRYGKKEDRKKCAEKWAKLPAREQRAILSHVPAYVRQKPDVQFRKNPLTYLNGQCWKDPISSGTTTPPPGQRQFVM